MARTPDKTTLRRWLREGLTQQQIADRWADETGENCSRAAVGMAIARYGLKSANSIERYDDLIPWRVKSVHSMNRHVRHLRWLSRRRRGLGLSDEESRRLDAWLQKLETSNAVVHYDPDTPQGFWLVHREPSDGDDPIRRPEEEHEGA